MTTKQLDKILEPHCPAGVLYNLHKVRGQGIWRLQVYNQAEWEARGVLASYLQVDLDAGAGPADLVEGFEWACGRQRAYDWQKQEQAV